MFLYRTQNACFVFLLMNDWASNRNFDRQRWNKESYSTADFICIQHNEIFMMHCNPGHNISSQQHEYDYNSESKNDSVDNPSNRNVYLKKKINFFALVELLNFINSWIKATGPDLQLI